jgi:hypothetical protein
MTTIEVSEDGVRRAVGGEVFGQAREWAGCGQAVR